VVISSLKGQIISGGGSLVRENKNHLPSIRMAAAQGKKGSKVGGGDPR